MGVDPCGGRQLERPGEGARLFGRGQRIGHDHDMMNVRLRRAPDDGRPIRVERRVTEMTVCVDQHR